MEADKIKTIASFLHAHYVPLVEQLLGDTINRINAGRRRYHAFTESMLIEHSYEIRLEAEHKGFELWHLELTFAGGELSFNELQKVMKWLETFTGYEDDEGAVLDGRRYFIGDGDDWLAVTFKDGKFRIWIRYIED